MFNKRSYQFESSLIYPVVFGRRQECPEEILYLVRLSKEEIPIVQCYRAIDDALEQLFLVQIAIAIDVVCVSPDMGAKVPDTEY